MRKFLMDLANYFRDAGFSDEQIAESLRIVSNLVARGKYEIEQ